MGGEEKKKQFIINMIYYFLIGGIVIASCKYILPVLVPFIMAFLIAAFIQILIKKLRIKSHIRKKITAIGFCILFYSLFFMAVIFFGVKLLEGIGNMIASAPAIYNEAIAPVLGKIADVIETLTVSIDPDISQKIAEVFMEVSKDLGQYITDFSVKAVKLVSGGATKIPSLIVQLVVTVVATFFMAVDFDRIAGFLKKHIPEGKGKNLRSVVEHVKSVIFVYLKSYVFLFFLTFLELTIGFLILKIPYAGILALIIAVFDILPALGTGGILLPWAAILLLMGNLPLAIGLLVLYVVITIVRNIVEPRIVGKQIGIHPLATLILMFIGLKLLGLVGMILFPVALSIAVNLDRSGVIQIKGKREN